MRTVGLIRAGSAAMTIIAVIFSVFSCSNPTSISIISDKARIQVDTVTIREVPTQFDTLTLYLGIELSWGMRLNPTRADSLADWFAQSQLKISDMWFPLDDPICARSYVTFNEVYLRLERPDTMVSSLGLYSTDAVSPCFLLYKHYRFIRTSTAR